MAGAMTTVRFIRLALLLILITVLQTAVFPHLRIAGVVPELGLVAAVAIAVRYGPELGAAFGFAAGLALDLFLQTPLGLAALAFGLTAYLVGAMQNTLARPAVWMRPAIAAGAGVVAGLLFVGLGALVGQDQLFVRAFAAGDRSLGALRRSRGAVHLPAGDLGRGPAYRNLRPRGRILTSMGKLS